jgi:thioredoxin reductase (NADPH)
VKTFSDNPLTNKGRSFKNCPNPRRRVKGCVDLDPKGFVATGALRLPGEAGPGRAAFPLETSLHGVFAIGDVRSGSTKRVAAAVGEGAAVVAQIHSVFARAPE